MQNKLNIRIVYFEKYLQKIGFKISDYFYNSDASNFNKNNLKNKLDEFLSKNNINKNYFNVYLNTYFKKTNSYEKEFIDIYSPFFELVCKNNIISINYLFLFLYT